MKYTANYLTSNGTRLMEPTEDTNLERIVRHISSLAEGETMLGSTCTWWVADEDGNEIVNGGIFPDGDTWNTL